MKNTKKIAFNLIFLVICIGVTLYYVFHGEDFSEVMWFIKEAKGLYWILGVILVILFILSESFIIYYLMRSLNVKAKINHCFLYSFVGFFFSLVTPTASGGQPMQLLFMKKDGLPIHVSTIVLLLVTITYKTVLLIIGLLIIIFRPSIELGLLEPAMNWIYLGLVLNFAVVGFMIALVFSPEMTKRLVLKFIDFLQGIFKTKKLESFRNRALNYMEEYKETSQYIKNNRFITFEVLIITFVQRCMLFLVTYIVLKSFGINLLGPIDVIALQGSISLSVDMLPLPGGMGISEHLFEMIFTPICGENLTTPAMVISRGLSFYGQLLISAVFTIVGYFIIFERKEKR